MYLLFENPIQLATLNHWRIILAAPKTQHNQVNLESWGLWDSTIINHFVSSKIQSNTTWHVYILENNTLGKGNKVSFGKILFTTWWKTTGYYLWCLKWINGKENQTYTVQRNYKNVWANNKFIRLKREEMNQVFRIAHIMYCSHIILQVTPTFTFSKLCMQNHLTKLLNME